MTHDTPTATTLAYVAGLLDGEGSFCIGAGGTEPDRVAVHYWLQVQITNTDRTLIDWLLATFGGHISDNSHAPSRPNRRPCWAWRVMGPQAVPFLEAIQPYVRIKAPQLRLALEVQRHMSAPRTYHRVPAAHLVLREDFRQRLQALNRGPGTVD
jgi:hypothetical protein